MYTSNMSMFKFFVCGQFNEGVLVGDTTRRPLSYGSRSKTSNGIATKSGYQMG